MKQVTRLTVIVMILLSSAFAQTSKPAWKEMKTFHTYMATTFHPAEEGDLKPLIAKADSMYIVAKLWQDSPIPPDFKPVETKAALQKLVVKCADIRKMVTAKAGDDLLLKEITEAHEIFHHIVGECKKGE